MNFLKKIFGKKQPKDMQQSLQVTVPVKQLTRISIVRDLEGKSLWPERHSESDIESILSNISYFAAHNEYFNSPVPDSNTVSGHNDFSGFGGGDFGGGGASDSCSDNSSNFDSGNSFDTSSSGSSDW